MNHIGNVIRQLRMTAKMSQRELSTNICTEKYVYLIEKGERIPSTDILSAFSKKLEIDIFSYYPYLNCRFPVEVHEYLEHFDFFRRKLEYDNLKEVSNQALNICDFQIEPWCYEITINKISYSLFVDNDVEQVIYKTREILERIDRIYIHDDQLANIYILLSTALQMCGRFTEAKKVTKMAYSIARKKKKQKTYKLLIKATYLNLMTVEYFVGEYAKAIAYGSELVQYQNDIDAYEWAHFTYFYLAFSYSRSGREDEAVKWFMKGLHLVIVHERIIDVFFIRTFPEFDLLLNDCRISHELVHDFTEIYSEGNRQL